MQRCKREFRSFSTVPAIRRGVGIQAGAQMSAAESPHKQGLRSRPSLKSWLRPLDVSEASRGDARPARPGPTSCSSRRSCAATIYDDRTDGATVRHADSLLCPPPLPAGCYPIRDLALPTLHLELPRCRRSAGGARIGDQQRDYPAMGAEIRASCRAESDAHATDTACSVASR
jgi:hypothetical protein